MMKILHVTCSPRGHASESLRLSQEIISHLLKSRPMAQVLQRPVGNGQLAPLDESYAESQQASSDISSEGSAAHSEVLIRELGSSDCVVIATPMHNFTVPAALKIWIDHVVRVRRTFNVGPLGKTPLLQDRPVFVAVSSGGRFSGDYARQPDFLTPYLRAIFAIIGLRNLTFFSVQGMAVGPDAVAEARTKAAHALQRYFSSAEWETTP